MFIRRASTHSAIPVVGFFSDSGYGPNCSEIEGPEHHNQQQLTKRSHRLPPSIIGSLPSSGGVTPNRGMAGGHQQFCQSPRCGHHLTYRHSMASAQPYYVLLGTWTKTGKRIPAFGVIVDHTSLIIGMRSDHEILQWGWGALGGAPRWILIKAAGSTRESPVVDRGVRRRAFCRVRSTRS